MSLISTNLEDRDKDEYKAFNLTHIYFWYLASVLSKNQDVPI